MPAAVLLCDNTKHQVQKIGWFMGVSFRPFYDCAIICRYVRCGFFFTVPHSLGDIHCATDDSEVRGKSLMNHAANTYGIEATLAISNLLCPEVVEIKDCIFISEFYNGNIDSLVEQYNGDRKKIEMYVNSWSLADFFLLASDESVHKDEIIEEFGKVIKYYWKLRFKAIFPERNITVEVRDGIMGELGLTVTVYQQ